MKILNEEVECLVRGVAVFDTSGGDTEKGLKLC
jgi:hypothetical protein